jgi:hypothetical protein
VASVERGPVQADFPGRPAWVDYGHLTLRPFCAVEQPGHALPHPTPPLNPSCVASRSNRRAFRGERFVAADNLCCCPIVDLSTCPKTASHREICNVLAFRASPKKAHANYMVFTASDPQILGRTSTHAACNAQRERRPLRQWHLGCIRVLVVLNDAKAAANTPGPHLASRCRNVSRSRCGRALSALAASWIWTDSRIRARRRSQSLARKSGSWAARSSRAGWTSSWNLFQDSRGRSKKCQSIPGLTPKCGCSDTCVHPI